MSEAKTYKKQEASEDYVAEPMAMKYSAVAEDAGYLIPNGEVYGLLAGRMGWK